jgi:hypothetical protein
MTEDFREHPSIKRMMSYIESAKLFEYDKWIESLPFIQFPAHWEVKVIPPFTGAIIRFRIREVNKPHEISVYFDGYDQLGSYGSPYWEIYPDTIGDVSRYSMYDTKNLLIGIQDSLDHYNNR